MSKYRLLSLYWLIPSFLLFLVIQQFSVYSGAKTTYESGDVYEAQIIDFDMKQIAAQSNGYVVIEFTTNSGQKIERRMTLSIQMGQQVMQSSVLALSYKKDAYPEIVLHATYALQVKTSLFNAGVAFIGLIVTLIAGVYVQKFSNRKSENEAIDDFNIERVDL